MNLKVKPKLLIKLALLSPELDLENIKKKLNKEDFFWIKKRSTPKEKEQIWLMGNKSFVFEPKPYRIYPQQNLFSHVLGQTDDANEGISGIEKFFEEEIYLREQKNLPPFSRLIAFIISSKNEQESYLEAQKIKRSLSLLKGVDIMGPVSSPIFKIKNKYRTRLLLRSNSNFFVQKEISKILKKINISKKIKLTVDVDPLNFS